MRWFALPACRVLVPAAYGQVEVHFEDNAVPDLVAALMTVTLSKEVSTAHYHVDNSDQLSEDTYFSTFRIPWSREYDVGDGEKNLYVEAVLGVLWGSDAIELDTPSGPATVDEEWRAIGASGAVGWNFPLRGAWRVRPGVSLGLAYLDNSASYNAAGEVELKPFIDGTLVNWDAWAAISAATLTLERQRDTAHMDYGLSGRYVLAHTNVFAATDDVQVGTDTSQFLVARADVGGPTSLSYAEQSVDWDVFGSWLGLFDVEESSLGFDELFNLGAGLSLRAIRGLPRLRLSAAWIFGEDIDGWSVGIGLAN